MESNEALSFQTGGRHQTSPASLRGFDLRRYLAEIIVVEFVCVQNDKSEEEEKRTKKKKSKQITGQNITFLSL